MQIIVYNGIGSSLRTVRIIYRLGYLYCYWGSFIHLPFNLYGGLPNGDFPLSIRGKKIGVGLRKTALPIHPTVTHRLVGTSHHGETFKSGWIKIISVLVHGKAHPQAFV